MNVELGYSNDLIEREHACHEGVGTEENDFRNQAFIFRHKYMLRRPTSGVIFLVTTIVSKWNDNFTSLYSELNLKKTGVSL